jgi:hypothetical protein
VAFYVALTHEACKRVDFIQAVKALLPTVGIIRVKPDGKCRSFLMNEGQKDWELAKARPTTITIQQPNNFNHS